MSPKQETIKPEYIDLAIHHLPCSTSTYHKLHCNHVVKTDTVASCGTNCKVPGSESSFVCRACLSSKPSSNPNLHPSSDSNSEGHDTERDTIPTTEEDEWVSDFFAAHPEAFEVGEKRKTHRLGQGFWQLQEVQRTLDAAASPRGRGRRVGEEKKVDKRARRMEMEY